MATAVRPHWIQLRQDGATDEGSRGLLHRSQPRIILLFRSIFRSAGFSVYVYHSRNDPNSANAVRPIDAAVQITPEWYSPLLDE